MRALKYVLLALLSALLVREVVTMYLWFVRDGKTLKDFQHLDSVTVKDEFIKEAYTYKSWLTRLLTRLGFRVRLEKSHATGTYTFTAGDDPAQVLARIKDMMDADPKETT